MVHKYSHNKTSVSIIGARGYAGLELARLLLSHAAVKLETAFATREFSLQDELMLESAAQVACLTDDQIMHHLADVNFLATPAEISSEIAPAIVAKGKTVIDLSGAFRLTQSGSGREASRVAGDYRLVPFCGPQAMSSASLICNPGCYATAVQMALIPLLKHDLIALEGVAIDAKSGTTGAGRKAVESQLFAEVDGECMPYRVGVHQHLPEIITYIEKYSGRRIDPHFVTHLLPTRRGIECAVFATAKTTNLKDIAAAYHAEYHNYPLLRHGADYTRLAKLSHVVGTPYTHISYQLVGQKLYVFTVLDNLLKGAASQAVENLNLLLDLPVHFALRKEH